jgi:hypothetical protein
VLVHLNADSNIDPPTGPNSFFFLQMEVVHVSIADENDEAWLVETI